MGLPETRIEFVEKADSFIRRLGRGMVCWLHISAGASKAKVYTLRASDDLDKVLTSETDKEKLVAQTKRMFEFGASRVLIVVAQTFDIAKPQLELLRFNYLACPEAPAEMLAWAREVGYKTGRAFILFTDTEEAANSKDGHVVAVYPAAAQVAVGTPMDIAAITAGCTDRSTTNYTVVHNSALTAEQVAAYPGKTEANTKTDAGYLTLFNDGEKIKIGRGITSHYRVDALEPNNDTQRSKWSKVRSVDVMNLIKDDIADTFENTYRGKVGNSYENKMNFCTQINGTYFKNMSGDLLNPDAENFVDVNVNKHIELIKAQGVDPDTMSESEIRKYDTGSVVMLSGKVTILDMMEDLDIVLTV